MCPLPWPGALHRRLTASPAGGGAFSACAPLPRGLLTARCQLLSETAPACLRMGLLRGECRSPAWDLGLFGGLDPAAPCAALPGEPRRDGLLLGVATACLRRGLFGGDVSMRPSAAFVNRAQSSSCRGSRVGIERSTGFSCC